MHKFHSGIDSFLCICFESKSRCLLQIMFILSEKKTFLFLIFNAQCSKYYPLLLNHSLHEKIIIITGRAVAISKIGIKKSNEKKLYIFTFNFPDNVVQISYLIGFTIIAQKTTISVCALCIDATRRTKFTHLRTPIFDTHNSIICLFMVCL